MTAPTRLRLRMEVGFNLQELSVSTNGLPAVKVDRASKWGNPFKVGAEGPLGRNAPDWEGAVGFFREMLRDQELREAAGYPSDAEIRTALRGKNLACWCSGPHCHADALLEVANADLDKEPNDE